MRSANMFTQGRNTGRTGLVCSMLGRGTLRDRAAVQGLLCCWGGEALHGHDPDMQRMAARLGTPSLVVLNHPMPHTVKTSLFPDLVTAFRDAHNTPEQAGSDIIHHASLPAACVVDVLDAQLAAESGRLPELLWLLDGPHF